MGEALSRAGLASAQLRQIPPNRISRNPDNPRLFFRSEEMDTLLASIGRYGIQVPLTVYEDNGNFVLIDGERRWRCAVKLNFKSVPALVQPKPTALGNLLLMFNIHALREQWDYFTIANKLPDVIYHFREENAYEPNEVELSEVTGLTRGQIRRCRLLLDLPARYKKMLSKELSLPKQKQTLSEDFFIEMERSLKTIDKRVPESLDDLNSVRDTLIDKFRRGVINNVTDFRRLSKIATSIENIGVRHDKARGALDDIFNAHNDVGIQEVYSEYFELRYDERKVSLHIESIFEFLEYLLDVQEVQNIQLELRKKLEELRDIIDRVLER